MIWNFLNTDDERAKKFFPKKHVSPQDCPSDTVEDERGTGKVLLNSRLLPRRHINRVFCVFVYTQYLYFRFIDLGYTPHRRGGASFLHNMHY